MTRSAKIAITVALSIVVIIASGMAVGIYYFVEFQKGQQLFQEGYDAGDREDDDIAIAKLSEALRHKLTKNDLAVAYSSRGAAYRSKQKYDESVRDFSEAIRLYPEWSHAYFGRAWTYQRKGEPDKAISDYAEAIRHDRNSGWAYYNRGLLYLRRQQWASAIADFDEAIRCLPTNSTALLARGLGYLGKKDFDRALASFDGAIAVESSNWQGFLYRSNIYFIKGETDKQLRDYKEALRLASVALDNHPQTSPSPVNNYVSAFEEVGRAHKEGNFDRAIELSNKLLDMEMTWRQASPVVMNRGNAFSAKGDVEKALVDYDQAIAFNPNNAGAHVDRALAWDKKGQRDQALRDYAEAIRLNPQMWEAYFNRAATRKETGEFGKAIDDLNEVIRLTPGYAPAYVNRAVSYYHQGEVEKALNDWNRAVELNPNQVEAYVARTTVYMRKKDFGKAVQNLEATARLNPKHLDDVLNSLAWLRATCPSEAIRNGKAAVETAIKACELTEWKNGGYIDTLAAAYAESGDFDAAIKFQEQAVAMTESASGDRKGMEERLALYQKHKPYRAPNL